MAKVINIDDFNLSVLKNLRSKQISSKGIFNILYGDVRVEFCARSLKIIGVKPYQDSTCPHVLFDASNMQIESWNIFANTVNDCIINTVSTLKNTDVTEEKLLVFDKDDNDKKMCFNLHECEGYVGRKIANVEYIDRHNQTNIIKNYSQFQEIVPMHQHYDITFSVQFYTIIGKTYPWVYLTKISPTDLREEVEYCMYSKNQIRKYYEQRIKDLTENINTVDDRIYV